MTRYIVMGGVGILIVACGIFAYQYMLDNPSTPEPKQDIVSVTDSLKVEKPGVVKDSINIKKNPLNKKKTLFPQSLKNKKRKKEKIRKSLLLLFRKTLPGIIDLSANQ